MFGLTNAKAYFITGCKLIFSPTLSRQWHKALAPSHLLGSSLVARVFRGWMSTNQCKQERGVSLFGIAASVAASKPVPFQGPCSDRCHASHRGRASQRMQIQA